MGRARRGEARLSNLYHFDGTGWTQQYAPPVVP